MMEGVQNPQSDPTLGSSIPDSKFSSLLKKKNLIIVMILISIILIIPLFIFISSTINQNSKATPTPTLGGKEDDPFIAPYVADELIVKYRESYTFPEIENLKGALESLGVVSQKKIFDSDDPALRNYYLLTFKKGTDVKEAKKRLDNLSEIEFSGPNSIVSVQAIPNDPMYSDPGLWGLNQIKMPDAWDISTGSPSVLVAVIDTGIDLDHPDLRANVIGGANTIDGGSADDDNGHGTHVAGTIGAVGNNNLGVSGVNWSVGLMGFKVLESSGRNGQMSWVLQAITDAADAANIGVKVINMSLGTNNRECSPDYQAAIDYAISKRVVVVVAAGNAEPGGQAINVDRATPASCDGVIVVGNSNQNDQRSPSSNFGPRVSIAAPGEGIYSTYKNGSYNTLSGTSMAAPHVAGVAALLLAVNPSLSPQDVKNCLVNNADSITQDPQKPIGPRLNAYEALRNFRNCGGGQPPPITSLTVTPTQPGQSSSSISGSIFVDINGNGTKDSEEPGFTGARISLEGPVNLVVSSEAGNFNFLNLNEGPYAVNMSKDGQIACSSSVNLPRNTQATLTPCPIPASGQPGPTPIIVLPTILPTPTLKPSPTPVKTYTCRERSDSNPGKIGAIKIGDLICEPN